MNGEGGVDNLDNKRNEIRPDDWKASGVDQPQEKKANSIVALRAHLRSLS
jgi:hypothetical protein